jgi:uncharacterized protein
MKPLYLDTDEFTRLGASRSGLQPLGGLSRLGSLLSDSDGELSWRVGGESQRRSDGSLARVLHLRLEGQVRLICARCLRPRDYALSVKRSFLLARSEAEAARLDDLDDDSDVLVGSRRFNLSDLIEDEAILALPTVVTHPDCRLQSSDGLAPGDEAGGVSEQGAGRLQPSTESAATGTRKPFAALADFKPKSGS